MLKCWGGEGKIVIWHEAREEHYDTTRVQSSGWDDDGDRSYLHEVVGLQASLLIPEIDSQISIFVPIKSRTQQGEEILGKYWTQPEEEKRRIFILGRTPKGSWGSSCETNGGEPIFLTADKESVLKKLTAEVASGITKTFQVALEQ